MIEEQIIEMVKSLRRDVNGLLTRQQRADPVRAAWANAASMFVALPGLRAAWPMAGAGVTGGVVDVSGASRTLTNNGNALFGAALGLVPYIALDGSTQYLSAVDGDAWRILGTEAYIGSGQRGLTLGGWFRPTDATPAGEAGMTGKYTVSTPDRSYMLSLRPDGHPRMYISSDGTSGNTASLEHTATLADDTWHFVIGRFVPSTSIDVWVDGDKESNTTSIPAAIFNSTAPFQIGAFNGAANFFGGRVSWNIVSAAALPDDWITGLYYSTRALYA